MPALFSRNRHKANRSRSQELLLLRDEIDQTMEKIDAARNHFEQAVDPTMIDC